MKKNLILALMVLGTTMAVNAAEQLKCPPKTLPSYECTNAKKPIASATSEEAVNIFRKVLICNEKEDSQVVVRNQAGHVGTSTYLRNSSDSELVLTEVEDDMLVSMITINKETLKAEAELSLSKTKLNCKKLR